MLHCSYYSLVLVVTYVFSSFLLHYNLCKYWVNSYLPKGANITFWYQVYFKSAYMKVGVRMSKIEGGQSFYKIQPYSRANFFRDCARFGFWTQKKHNLSNFLPFMGPFLYFLCVMFWTILFAQNFRAEPLDVPKNLLLESLGVGEVDVCKVI